MIRDLDIKIAILLGHYRTIGNRGWYDIRPESNGGMMAMAIFNKSVHDKHIYDDEGNQRWWKSESYIGDENEMWFTSAVPLYQEDLAEAFKLLSSIKDEVLISILNIGPNWNVQLQHKQNLDLISSSMNPTVQEAICHAFISYMEWKHEQNNR
jgi:hypothetical protein